MWLCFGCVVWFYEAFADVDSAAASDYAVDSGVLVADCDLVGGDLAAGPVL